MDKNQKRFRLLATTFCCLLSLSALAGGLMTNTNYHIAFDRMMARGASLEIDAIYSNPAGLAWTHEGWELSFNWQVPGQNRDIDTYVPNYLGAGNIITNMQERHRHPSYPPSSLRGARTVSP